MTKQQILDNIAILETDIKDFMLEMCDHWDADDYAYSARLHILLAQQIEQYTKTYNTRPLLDKCGTIEDVQELLQKLRSSIE